MQYSSSNTQVSFPGTHNMAPGDLSIHTYRGIDNTLYNIKQLIREFKDSPEVARFDNADLYQIFNFIARLPYREDMTNFEWLQSPRWTMYWGGDCDDKAILAGAIFERRGIPYRMAVVSTLADKELHHIYPEVYLNAWYPYDPTYAHNKIFEEEPFTLKRVYEWFGTDKTRTYEIHPDNKRIQRQRTLSGNSSTLGKSIQLAILRGNALGCPTHGKCNCGGNCMHGHTHVMSGQLGIDPGIVITAASVLFRMFGGFGREAYTDAYAAWSQLERTLGPLTAAAESDPRALAELAANRAVIAVLSRDIMNAPMGANFCSNPNDQYYCGNRAQWDVIQPDVMAKAQAFAPFMLWLNGKNIENKTPQDPYPMALENLVAYYDMFKNKSGLYTTFQSEGGQLRNASSTSFQKLVPWGIAAALIYFLS